MKTKLSILAALLISIIIFNSCKTSAKIKSVKKEPLHHTQLWKKKTDKGWENFEITTFKYNKNRQLVEQVTEAINDDTLALKSRILHIYDSKKNKIKSIRELRKNNQWVLINQSIYKYDSDKITQQFDSIVRNNNFMLLKTIYDYDKEGLLISEITQNNTEEKSNRSKVVYHYNDKGLVVEKEYPIWSKDNWVKKRKMNFEYNEDGHQIQTIRYNWQENNWVVNIQYDLEVDKDGRRLKEFWKRNGKDYIIINYDYLPE